jgi:hypothetical protein
LCPLYREHTNTHTDDDERASEGWDKETEGVSGRDLVEGRYPENEM